MEPKKPRPNTDHTVMRHALEDADQRTLIRKAEPLAVLLRPGINYLDPAEFLLMLRFFEDSILDMDLVIKHGRTKIYGTFILVRVPQGALLSIAEIAKKAGVSRQTITRWVDRAKVPFSFRGRKKIYNIHGLQLKLS